MWKSPQLGPWGSDPLGPSKPQHPSLCMLLCGIPDLWAPGAQSVSRGDGPFHIKKNPVLMYEILKYPV